MKKRNWLVVCLALALENGIWKLRILFPGYSLWGVRWDLSVSLPVFYFIAEGKCSQWWQDHKASTRQWQHQPCSAHCCFGEFWVLLLRWTVKSAHAYGERRLLGSKNGVLWLPGDNLMLSGQLRTHWRRAQNEGFLREYIRLCACGHVKTSRRLI